MIRPFAVMLTAVLLAPLSVSASVLYVHNGASSRIDSYDTDSGSSQGTFLNGNFQTAGLAVGDGLLYVHNGASSRIDRYSITTGAFVDTLLEDKSDISPIEDDVRRFVVSL